MISPTVIKRILDRVRSDRVVGAQRKMGRTERKGDGQEPREMEMELVEKRVGTRRKSKTGTGRTRMETREKAKENWEKMGQELGENVAGIGRKVEGSQEKWVETGTGRNGDRNWK